MPAEHALSVASPLGTLLLVARDDRLVRVIIEAPARDLPAPADTVHPVLELARNQLGEYLAGSRKTFELPLQLPAWPRFSLHVLELLRAVPYGEVLTYGELARRAGSPRAARAVGQVMAANPLPIVIPCHRVVAAGGLPGGYSGGGGLVTKEWLLALEQNRLPGQSGQSCENCRI